MMTFPIYYGKITNVPNHQPVMNVYDVYVLPSWWHSTSIWGAPLRSFPLQPPAPKRKLSVLRIFQPMSLAWIRLNMSGTPPKFDRHSWYPGLPPQKKMKNTWNDDLKLKTPGPNVYHRRLPWCHGLVFDGWGPLPWSPLGQAIQVAIGRSISGSTREAQDGWHLQWRYPLVI